MGIKGLYPGLGRELWDQIAMSGGHVVDASMWIHNSFQSDPAAVIRGDLSSIVRFFQKRINVLLPCGPVIIVFDGPDQAAKLSTLQVSRGNCSRVI